MVLRGPYSAPLPAVPSASWGPCGLGEALSSLWASLSVFEVRGGVAATPVSPAARGAQLTCLLSAGVERLAVRPSLESLLAASSHMLKEVLDSPFVDPLKNLRLPRELNPNKKYSWMQKKEERVRCSGPCFWPVAWGVGVETGPPEISPCLGAWLALELEGPGPSPASTTDLLCDPGALFPFSRPQFTHLIMCLERVPLVVASWVGRAPCCPRALGRWRHFSEPCPVT